MTALRLLVPVIAGLMLLLTYFLVQGATPDPALHERTLDAFRQLILSDADLRRGVLAARTGRLRNYDPLVRAVEDMRDAAIRLQTADHVAGAAAQGDIRDRIEQSAAAVRDQESLRRGLQIRQRAAAKLAGLSRSCAGPRRRRHEQRA